MSCGPECLAERIAALGLRAFAIVARATSETCGIVRVVDPMRGDHVVKFLKLCRPEHRDYNRTVFERRAAVANAHPRFFAPMEFDADAWLVRQPFYAGELTSAADCRALIAALRREGLGCIGNINWSNVFDTPDGPRITDFTIASGSIDGRRFGYHPIRSLEARLQPPLTS